MDRSLFYVDLSTEGYYSAAPHGIGSTLEALKPTGFARRATRGWRPARRYATIVLLFALMPSSVIQKLLRDPLTICLIIGAVLFAVDGLRGSAGYDDEDATITIEPEEIARLGAQWTGQMGREPTQSELDALLDEYVREEILVREARKMGLDQNDVIVRRRLAQKLQFLTEDLAVNESPDDSALSAYFDANVERYRQPATVSFSHIYLAGHDDGVRERAAATLAELQDAATGWRELGDAFMLRRRYEGVSERDIARDFGPGFAEAVIALGAGPWQGPVRSEYGLHLVQVSTAAQSYLPTVDAVRQRVLADYVTDQRKSANDRFFAALRARYTVEQN